MQRYLIAVGAQPEKVKLCGRDGKKLIEWIQARSGDYDRVISVVRKDLKYDNFNKMGDSIANKDDVRLDYMSHQVIVVPGYGVDCSNFPPNVEYDIVGISTAASVLCIAMSMFSAGLKIHVLENRCIDRKGKKTHEAAITIMKAYMPIVLE